MESGFFFLIHQHLHVSFDPFQIATAIPIEPFRMPLFDFHQIAMPELSILNSIIQNKANLAIITVSSYTTFRIPYSETPMPEMRKESSGSLYQERHEMDFHRLLLPHV